MELDIILYFIVIVLYIILFYNLFKSNIEGLIIAFLFVTTIFAGFKLLYDLYKDMTNSFIIYKSIYGFSKFVEIVQNPTSIIVLILLILLSLFLYLLGSMNEDFLITSCTFFMFAIFALFVDLDKELPLVYLYAIPVTLVLVSLMILLYSIVKFSDGMPFREQMKLSPKNRKRFKRIKNMLVAIFSLITLSLTIFSTYGTRLKSSETKISKNEELDNKMMNRDGLIVICMFVAYVLSGYTTYESRELAFLNKFKTDCNK